MQACQENGGSIGKATLVNQSRIAVQGAGAILNCDGELCSPTDLFGITRDLKLQIMLGTIRLRVHIRHVNAVCVDATLPTPACVSYAVLSFSSINVFLAYMCMC